MNTWLDHPRFHFYSSYEAARLATLATERYFDDLRRDLGNEHFDRLFAVHPTMNEIHAASQAIAQMRSFRFFTSSISSSIQMSSRLVDTMKTIVRQRITKFKSSLFSKRETNKLDDLSLID
jgi:hypothetical protein